MIGKGLMIVSGLLLAIAFFVWFPALDKITANDTDWLYSHIDDLKLLVAIQDSLKEIAERELELKSWNEVHQIPSMLSESHLNGLSRTEPTQAEIFDFMMKELKSRVSDDFHPLGGTDRGARFR
jgi:flagellar biosynthesis protein FliP